MRRAVYIAAGVWMALANPVRLVAGSPAAPPVTVDHGRGGAPLVIEWNQVALEAVRRSSYAPTVVARALGIVHTCIYDAWAAYDPVALGTRLGGALRRPAHERHRANKSQAISVAAYRALVDLFPHERGLFDDALTRLDLAPIDDSTDVSTPAGVGNVACAAVLAYRHADGANQFGDLNSGAPYSDDTDYMPINTPDHVVDPDRWQPLRFANGQVPGFTTPHWGHVTPFAMEAGDVLRPPAPAGYPDETYIRQAERLVRTSASLTDRQKAIVEYWADGPSSERPPGHWNLFAQAVATDRRYDLDRQVVLFFALNGALLDASIAAWECKRFYDYVRPITAIRFLFRGTPIEAWGGPYQGTRLIDGATWLPYQPATFVTPPFPEYVSGHSTFSAAAAEILRRFSGGDAFGHGVVIAAGSSRIEPGATPARDVTLLWPTFSAAADEAGRSRRLGGIHFVSGDLEGRTLGRQVGARAWRRVHELLARRSDRR